jgi:hypothetical protein
MSAPRGTGPLSLATTDGGYVVNGWLQYAHPEHAHLDSEGVSVPWVNGGESLPCRTRTQHLRAGTKSAECRTRDAVP